jgi:hypothetical protein
MSRELSRNKAIEASLLNDKNYVVHTPYHGSTPAETLIKWR